RQSIVSSPRGAGGGGAAEGRDGGAARPRLIPDMRVRPRVVGRGVGGQAERRAFARSDGWNTVSTKTDAPRDGFVCKPGAEEWWRSYRLTPRPASPGQARG